MAITDYVRRPTFTVTSLILAAALFLPKAAGAQTTFHVGSEAALRTAIASAGTNDLTVLDTNVTLTRDLPSVVSDITIDGDGHTLSGNGQFRGLVIGRVGEGFEPVSVTVIALTIADTVARGGNGGSGHNGGGGGGGFGGAV